MSTSRVLVVVILAALLGAFFYFDAGSALSLDNLKAQQAELQAGVDDNLLLALTIYFVCYVVMAALSIPGATVVTLAGGALFGVVTGTVVVSFASTIGATLACGLSRYLFRDAVESKFSLAAAKINEGVKKDGAYYLFGLRLVPLFPFFVINLVMGLTRLPLPKFFWVSQLGMLPGTIVYVNAGTQIGRLDSLSGILSPALIGSFVLLALFPLIARTILRALNNRRALSRFTKPKSFDTNLIVIGAGAAGLVTSYVAAAAKARVTLIEKDRMGGDCLNTGCVPSKALIRSASAMQQFRRAAEYGLNVPNLPQVNFDAVMGRVHSVISAIEPHDSVERYTGLGVDCMSGIAKITSPWSVEIDGQKLTAPNIVIATGGEPFVPPIPGLDQIEHQTSDTLWSLQVLPPRLLVLGGGFIGCELAQAFQRLGSQVTMVERMPRLLSNEDPDVSAAIEERFKAEGIEILTGFSATGFNGKTLTSESAAGGSNSDNRETREIPFDEVLVAVGRKARTANLGLEELGIEVNDNGTVATDEYLQTSIPTIYACGDVAGPFQLTHFAAHQAWYCAVNALFGRFKRFKADYSVIPRGVYTAPEIARVGLNETEARVAGIKVEVTTYGTDDLDRAIADNEAHGFVKVLTPPGSDKILGVTIVGAHAAEMLAEYTLAMRHGLGLKKILGTVHPYPTYSEANKFAAGQWQQKHLPGKLLNIARWYNDRRRS